MPSTRRAMPSRGKTNYYSAAKGVVDKVWEEQQASSERLDSSAEEIHQWFTSTIEAFKQSYLQSRGISNVKPVVTEAQNLQPPNKKAKKEDIDLLPFTADDVSKMRVRELRENLRELGLECNGRKADLQQRLYDVIEEHSSSKNEVTLSQNQALQSQSPKVDGFVAPAPKNAGPTPEIPEVEKMDISVNHDIVEAPAQMDISVDKEIAPSEVPEPPATTMSNQSVGDTKNELVAEDSELKNQSIASSLPGSIIPEEPKQSDSKHSFSPPLVEQTPAIPSKLPENKVFRSPMKAIQSGVQSAMKKFETKSPLPLPPWSAQKKRADAEVLEISQRALVTKITTKENDGNIANKPAVASKISPVAPTAVKPMPIKSASKRVDTKSGSALQSETVKAQNQARMAKYRSKVAGHQTLTTKPLPSKSLSAHKHGSAKTLATQMREKAASSRQLYKNGQGSHQSKPFQSKKPLLSKPVTLSVSDKTKSSYSSLLKKNGGSPMDTYSMSDNEDDKASSGSEDEDEEEQYQQQQRKYIPSWAKKDQFVPLLERQIFGGEQDPDEIFGDVKTCNLEAIFGVNDEKKRYKKRTSSGNWTQDRVTTVEKLAYKRAINPGIMASP